MLNYKWPIFCIIVPPGAILNTMKGYSLLIDPVVVGVVIDKCHMIEKWYAIQFTISNVITYLII